ncbi:hypothetical protein OQA88_5861 [Cercophora sp. LCS_1]
MHYLPLLTLALTASAIKLTSPTKNQEVDLSQPFTVTWETVASDPKSAHLVLVNMASGHTPYTKDLGTVDLTKGSATVSVADVPADKGFQFNLQSVEENNTGILAQSQQFVVEESEKKEEAKTTGTKTDEEESKTTVEGVKVTQAVESGDVKTTLAVSTTAAASASGSAAASASKSAGTANASSVPQSGASIMRGSVLALVVGLAAAAV